MPIFIFILGVLSTLLVPMQSNTPLIETAQNQSFFISIQQDSTPPARQKGVVKIKSLENPSKKKKTPKAKKSKSKQVIIKDSKPRKKAKKSNPTTPIKEEKEMVMDATKRPTINKQKKATKTKEIARIDTSKTPPPAKQAQGKGLSTEEEIKLLSRTKAIDAENKIHPESAENCRFAFDIIDEFTGVQKKGLDARPFFAYTPDEYRKFIKEDDFIRCEGFLSQSSEGGMALNINLYVASREAKQKFGAIKANSAMVLRTMEGKEYYLMTYPGAKPQVVENMTYYQCSFAINKSDLKHLKKAEIDQVKISFQKGFQSYDVFYLDFLIDQFPCFEK